jgi:hypothetical protein
MNAERWLTKFARLKVYKAKHGEAPHKPLLLLLVLELGERGELKDLAALTGDRFPLQRSLANRRVSTNAAA